MRDMGSILAVAGGLLIAIAFIWSVVLGWRKSPSWFWCLLLAWIVFYPIFVARNWQLTKRNFAMLGVGLLVLCFAFFILVTTNPLKAPS